MPLFKCKMCGGDLQLNDNMSVGECGYCGTRQTLPRLDDDKRANLYDRANHFRRNGEFDKAASIYESILNEDKTDAEAYWSLVLCKYGIEYVEDPRSHKRIPTCNRTQFTSIFADEDYKQAIANADASAKAIYEAEAKAIDEIQKGILNISAKEEPFDVFICYKESDQNGRRTPDSVLAQDLYFQLKQEGFKVFFSRITLEDKLGTAYEPYIFAALNSSKVMVAIGTKPENFNSAWVKNEWSRYLALIKNGANKTLIPGYKDMNPYDLPEEFSHLQSQDMSKLGFMQDLIRGVRKLTSGGEPKAATNEITVIQGNVNMASLLERSFLCLEDGDWSKADQLLEQVLNLDPKNAKAYIGKLMAELNVREESGLSKCTSPIADSNNYQKALRFSDEKMKNDLQVYNKTILDRLDTQRKEKIYAELMESKPKLKSEEELSEMAMVFNTLGDFKDAKVQAMDCIRLAEKVRQKRLWEEDEARALAERKQLEAERKAELARIASEKRRLRIKRMLKIGIPSVVVVIVFLVLFKTAIVPYSKYSMAQECIDRKNYAEALFIFIELGDYKDSEDLVISTKYSQAIDLIEGGNSAEATILLKELGDYKDSKELVISTKYSQAMDLIEGGNSAEAAILLKELGDYKDSLMLLNEIKNTSIKKANIGDTCFFGVYEQDNNLNNEEELIEWVVLDKKESRVLLISKACLAVQPYNKEYLSVTWQTSTIRNWLNNDFVNTAFSDMERAMIFTTRIQNPDNLRHNTTGGEETIDPVFLLDIGESELFFADDTSRQAAATNYAKSIGADGSVSGTWYWLRSPGIDPEQAAYVGRRGDVVYSGNDVDYNTGGIRPALWLTIPN